MNQPFVHRIPGHGCSQPLDHHHHLDHEHRSGHGNDDDVDVVNDDGHENMFGGEDVLAAEVNENFYADAGA